MIKNVYKPETVKDALKLLNKYNDSAEIIAGGTDVIIQLRNNRLDCDTLIDISDIEEMKFIKNENGFIEIGSNITFTDIVNSKMFSENLKGLKLAAQNVGSPQIRNRGTIGGNICNGSTAADIVPPLLALDAIVTIREKNNTREMPLEKFYIDRGKVDLNKNEMLYSIKFKNRSGNLSFVKLGLRKALAITRIDISVFLDIDDDDKINEVFVASGALSKFPIRERKVEEFLKNKILSEEVIQQSKEVFIKDLDERLEARYSKEFKVSASEGLFVKAMRDAIGRVQVSKY